MPEPLSKIEVTCPHCGSVQKESPAALSTYCRSCSEHFEIGVVRQVTKPKPRGPVREVHCYRCGGDHEVSKHARSTLCPSCGAGIELADLDFSANGSRPVDIRGRLRVRQGAHLNNSWIICTDAKIEGRVTGTLHCENKLELVCAAKLPFNATAAITTVGAKANVELGYPLRTGTLEIFGKLTGTVLCSGTVHVHKGGVLGGNLEARSIIVDRGGICEAFLKITTEHISPAEVRVW